MHDQLDFQAKTLVWQDIYVNKLFFPNKIQCLFELAH